MTEEKKSIYDKLLVYCLLGLILEGTVLISGGILITCQEVLQPTINITTLGVGLFASIMGFILAITAIPMFFKQIKFVSQ